MESYSLLEWCICKKSTDFAAELEVLKLKPLPYADKFIYSLITSNAVHCKMIIGQLKDDLSENPM